MSYLSKEVKPLKKKPVRDTRIEAEEKHKARKTPKFHLRDAVWGVEITSHTES